MKIIVPNLQQSISRKKLDLVISRILDGKFHLPFTKTPNLWSVDILDVVAGNSHNSSHYGLIVVNPDSAGQWLINKLRKSELNGRKLGCRQYFDRAVVSKIAGEEDRRRDNLHIQKISDDRQATVVSRGTEQFAITHDR